MRKYRLASGNIHAYLPPQNTGSQPALFLITRTTKMAVFDAHRPAAFGTAARKGSFVARTIAAIAAWNDARITRKALNKLSDRELEDIGLCRGDIDAVARG
jgi:uncharacterized protein YjiS (DUF1127 family)